MCTEEALVPFPPQCPGLRVVGSPDPAPQVGRNGEKKGDPPPPASLSPVPGIPFGGGEPCTSNFFQQRDPYSSRLDSRSFIHIASGLSRLSWQIQGQSWPRGLARPLTPTLKDPAGAGLSHST